MGVDHSTARWWCGKEEEEEAERTYDASFHVARPMNSMDKGMRGRMVRGKAG